MRLYKHNRLLYTASMTIDADAERRSAAAAIMGRKGGRATGPKKAQTPDHYRRIGKLGAAARIKAMREKNQTKNQTK